MMPSGVKRKKTLPSGNGKNEFSFDPTQDFKVSKDKEELVDKHLLLSKRRRTESRMTQQ